MIRLGLRIEVVGNDGLPVVQYSNIKYWLCVDFDYVKGSRMRHANQCHRRDKKYNE
jgi:hypothetical protein